MGRRKGWWPVAITSAAVVAVGVTLAVLDPPPTDKEVERTRIADDAAKDIDVMKQGERTGRTLRDVEIRNGAVPSKSVPDEAKCRARWDASGLEGFYGAQRADRYVTACAQVPYWDEPSGAPAG